MEKLYSVKSSYYLSQAQANFEYNWFVYQRSHPPKSQTVRIGATKPADTGLVQQIMQELFTLEEANQLLAILKTLYSSFEEPLEVTVTIEEVTAPEQLSPLKETYQSGGEFVDPADFAALSFNTLDFLVAAQVSNSFGYTADDFLSNLCTERLAALRQMHAKNNG